MAMNDAQKAPTWTDNKGQGRQRGGHETHTTPQMCVKRTENATAGGDMEGSSEPRLSWVAAKAPRNVSP